MDMDLIRIHVVYAIFGILFLWFAPETNSFLLFFCANFLLALLIY